MYYNSRGNFRPRVLESIRGQPLMIWGVEEIEGKKFRRPFSRKKKLRFTLQEKKNILKINFEMLHRGNFFRRPLRGKKIIWKRFPGKKSFRKCPLTPRSLMVVPLQYGTPSMKTRKPAFVDTFSEFCHVFHCRNQLLIFQA